MNPNTWIITTIALIGCSKLLFDAVFAIGRWAKGVEKDAEQKPKVTLDRLSWDLEQIGREIRDLKSALDGRYTELAGRVNADHITIRDFQTWRAGLMGEMAQHFHSQQMVDRMFKEGEQDRAGIHKELRDLQSLVYGRREEDAS